MQCEKCQGDVWDNRADNVKRVAQGKKPRPEFSCKDKDGCGWVKWAERPKKVFKSPPAPGTPDLEVLRVACSVGIEYLRLAKEPPTMADTMASISRFYHDLKGILNPISKQEPSVEPETDVDWAE